MTHLLTKLKDFVKRGLYNEALSHFHHHHHDETIISILPSLIKACSLCDSIHGVLQLHSLSLKAAFTTDAVVANSFLSICSKFSDVRSARHLFDEMPHRDTVTWNSLIMAYVHNGLLPQSLGVFKKMCAGGYVPKPEIIACVLSICSRVNGGIRFGREIHGFVVIRGMMKMSQSVFLSTALVDLYMRGYEPELRSAFHVFGEMEEKNEVSWTAMIGGFAAKGKYQTALDCFRQMQADGFDANRVTLISILPIFATLRLMNLCKEVHGYAFRRGFDTDQSFSSALMHAYNHLGGASNAARRIMERVLIRDVVVWTSVIESCARYGKIDEAVEHFNRMRSEGMEPNSITLLAVISVCTNRACLSKGRGMHSYCMKSGLISDLSVGNSLLNMYAKCGCLADSVQVFDQLPMRDSFSWSSLINAYGLAGEGKDALTVFNRMSQTGLEVDSVALLSTLSACNRGGLVDEAQELLRDATEEGKVELSREHYSCVIDLLGKSGRIEEAYEMARGMPMKPSIKIWSSLVSACADQGRLEVAEELGRRVVELEPDNAANYSLLSKVYAKCGRWQMAEDIRRLMRARGFRKTRGFTRIEVDSI